MPFGVTNRASAGRLHGRTPPWVDFGNPSGVRGMVAYGADLPIQPRRGTATAPDWSSGVQRVEIVNPQIGVARLALVATVRVTSAR